MDSGIPPLLVDIINLLAALIRLVGLGVFGFAIAGFALEVFRKGLQTWTVQVAVFLGTLGIAIAFAVFASPGSLGAFGIGAGAGLLLGLRGTPPEAAEEDAKKKK